MTSMSAANGLTGANGYPPTLGGNFGCGLGAVALLGTAVPAIASTRRLAGASTPA